MEPALHALAQRVEESAFAVGERPVEAEPLRVILSLTVVSGNRWQPLIRYRAEHR